MCRACLRGAAHLLFAAREASIGTPAGGTAKNLNVL